MFPIGTTINGTFQLLAALGEGGMGAVFKAFDEKNTRMVALKFLHRDFAKDQAGIRRFMQEGEILATIRHPRIVEVYSLETDAVTQLPFLIMEYFQGRKLTAFRQEFARDPIRLIRVFLDLLDGVRAFHARKVIHRDLKPANILINAAGDLKIVDFGIAKGSRKQTQTGLALGTPHYMAPEQCEGKPNITGKSDLYSLGIVLWEILVGRPPFDAPEDASDAFLAIILKHLSAPVPFEMLETTPYGAVFRPLLRGLLEKNPHQRPEIEFIVAFLEKAKEQLLERTGALEMRFPLDRLVLAGPFGEFHQGRDGKTNTPVVVQACPEDPGWSSIQFQARIDRLGQVRHPAVAAVLSHWIDGPGGRHFLAMGAPGPTSFAHARETLAQDQAGQVKAMITLLEGLAAIHAQGEIHGNLHPALVGFQPDGGALVSGLPMMPFPRMTCEEAGEAGLYVAPERWLPGHVGTPAGDVYAAGLLFWELLLGELPTSLLPAGAGRGSGRGAPAPGEEETLSLRPLSPKDPLFPFIELLLRMVKKDPRERPEVAGLLAALREIRSAILAAAPRGEDREGHQCLILTRDETLATLLGATLKEYGFPYRRAGSYTEIARLSAADPTIGWFVDLDGYLKPVPEISAMALQAAPEAKVVFLSTVFTPELVEECLRSQAASLLVKPLVVPRLVQLLNTLREEPELIEGEALFPTRSGAASTESEAPPEGRLHVLFFECGLCQERFGCTQIKPGSWACRGTETDFCPVTPEGWAPELYTVVVCPACLYANVAGRFQRPGVSEAAATAFLASTRFEERLKVALDLDYQGERGFREGLRSFELAALAVRELLPGDYDRQASGLFLKAAWLCRRFGKPLLETDYLSRSLECLMRLYNPYLLLSRRFPGWEAVRERLRPGQEPLSERAVVVHGFLGAELSARLGLDEQADFYYDKVFGLPFLSRYTMLSRHIHRAFRLFKSRQGRGPAASGPGASPAAFPPKAP
ncbi:MAG: DUF2225 domain-containing protein [Candidatus Riflebacteria bacterium]|nr:DUF2225 domain-containing protein [Candidatus Riflebacteria bacterium]